MLTFVGLTRAVSHGVDEVESLGGSVAEPVSISDEQWLSLRRVIICFPGDDTVMLRQRFPRSAWPGYTFLTCLVGRPWTQAGHDGRRWWLLTHKYALPWTRTVAPGSAPRAVGD